MRVEVGSGTMPVGKPAERGNGDRQRRADAPAVRPYRNSAMRP
jgi:hypothetical protein